MNNNILDIYDMLQEVAWFFGNSGFDGECCEGLSLVEFMALKKAYSNKDFSIQNIGNALNFTKSGATRIINRLEDKGYVRRERSALDGRVCCVSVTTKGTEVLTEIMDKYTVYLNEMFKDLEPQKVDNIKDVLEILVKLVRRQKFK